MSNQSNVKSVKCQISQMSNQSNVKWVKRVKCKMGQMSNQVKWVLKMKMTHLVFCMHIIKEE